MYFRNFVNIVELFKSVLHHVFILYLPVLEIVSSKAASSVRTGKSITINIDDIAMMAFILITFTLTDGSTLQDGCGANNLPGI